MKLNNRGWGLSFLITVGVFFLLVLLVVSIRIRQFTHQIKTDNSENSDVDVRPTPNSNLYIVLEEQLKNAGETYVTYHSTLVENTNDHIIVTFDELKKEGFIESLADPDGEGECKGYDLIKSNGDVKSFIQCSDYETTNYTLWVN